MSSYTDTIDIPEWFQKPGEPKTMLRTEFNAHGFKGSQKPVVTGEIATIDLDTGKGNIVRIGQAIRGENAR
jgi:hypothetical protein